MEKTEHTGNCCDTDASKIESKILNQIESSIVTTVSVSGMDCADEIAAIQKSLNHSKVSKVTANLMTSQVSVAQKPKVSLMI